MGINEKGMEDDLKFFSEQKDKSALSGFEEQCINDYVSDSIYHLKKNLRKIVSGNWYNIYHQATKDTKVSKDKEERFELLQKEYHTKLREELEKRILEIFDIVVSKEFKKELEKETEKQISESIDTNI